MREDYLEQIEKLREEISVLTTARKETELKIEQKARDADVLEARLSAVDSIIEATSLISTFTSKISDLEAEKVRLLTSGAGLSLENADLKREVETLKTQLAGFGQPRKVREPAGGIVVDKPITPATPVKDEEDVKQVSPANPIDESLLTVDKKKSQSPDSLQD